ncbi:sensor histidine kinase [Sediminicurvatus halobius]|uniref:histidine kinase n=1 Tax=Sediminicurvatus halobius TaxID=2182432 RepID=A0A2U2MWI8_9GAMM|nr:PAS domain S-box protein [Spiribacter halobius]PWG61223.1 hypothetical protein DEM34_17510 [Spiribacter halobius]UEX79194.1 PAS domain S-box protein [Spiribacter halobius]
MASQRDSVGASQQKETIPADEFAGIGEVACKQVMLEASDAMVLATSEGIIVGANLSAASMLGRSQDELTGMHVVQLHPEEERKRVLSVFEELRTVGHSLVEHRVLRADGSLVHAEVSGTRIRDQGTGEIFMLGVFRDIEKRREDESRQRAAVVREVHHRIKNHLQGLSGLLARHASREPALQPALRDVQGQIHSISLIHGLQSRRGSEQIWLCDMVRGVCQSIEEVWGLIQHITVTVNTTSPVYISTDECVPVALIVNELVGNAVKHGGGGWYSVNVEACVEGSPEKARVTVRNRGRLSEAFEISRGRDLSSGLGLVGALMPREGAKLDIRMIDGSDEVVSVLDLTPPVLAKPFEHEI